MLFSVLPSTAWSVHKISTAQRLHTPDRGGGVAAYLATALVATFGLAPAIAAAIAAIVVRRFFKPAYQEFCKAWSERIAKATGGVTS
jgi:biopolymer transport protein ExbB/TolQ